jgi:hypothetical protein
LNKKEDPPHWEKLEKKVQTRVFRKQSKLGGLVEMACDFGRPTRWCDLYGGNA